MADDVAAPMAPAFDPTVYGPGMVVDQNNTSRVIQAPKPTRDGTADGIDAFLATQPPPGKGMSRDETADRLDKFLSGETVQTPMSGRTLPEMSQGSSALEGWKAGISANFSPDISAAAHASGWPAWVGGFSAPVGAVKVGLETLSGKPGPATEAYNKELQASYDRIDASQQQWPNTYLGSDLAGGLAATAPFPFAKAKTVGEFAAQGAKMGGGWGMLSGIGAGRSTDERIENAIVGGAVGAIGGGVFGAGGGLIAGASKPGGVTSDQVVGALGRLGTQLPAGLATNNHAIQAITQALRQIPLVGTKIDDLVKGAATQLGQKSDELARTLAGGPAANPKDFEAIGDAVKIGINKAMSERDNAANNAYTALRSNHIDATQPVKTPTEMVAPLSRIVNDRIAAGADEKSIPIKGMQDLVTLLTRPEGATFEGLQRARTELSGAIKWDKQQGGGYYNADLKTARGVLTDAMESAVRTSAKDGVDPEAAVAAWKAADKLYGETIARNTAMRKFFGNATDGQTLDRILGWASNDPRRGNIAQLGQMRLEMGQQNFNAIAAYSIQRMGLDKKNEFSPAIFLNNYSQMSEAAKNIMFGKGGTQTRQFIDDISTISARLNSSAKFANHSNTAGAAVVAEALNVAAGGDPNPIEALKDHMKAVGFGGGAAALLGIALAKPATAASMAKWARAYEIMNSTGRAGLGALKVATRNFGATIGNSFGSKHVIDLVSPGGDQDDQ